MIKVGDRVSISGRYPDVSEVGRKGVLVRISGMCFPFEVNMEDTGDQWCFEEYEFTLYSIPLGGN